MGINLAAVDIARMSNYSLYDREAPGMNRLGDEDPVPRDLFYSRPCVDGYERPVAMILVDGFRFKRCNECFLVRSRRVELLLDDMLREFGAPEYQQKLSAVADRHTLQEIARSTQLQVMKRHGFPSPTPGKVHALVMAMKYWNWLGMQGVPIVQQKGALSIK